MGKSLLKLFIFSVLPFSVICYAVFLTGKKTDDFYKRFISPQQNSLILGSSRAAGMNPAILDSILNRKFPEVKLYNYAFTWAHSPYGPKYLESIKKKVYTNSRNGIFIVTVEPTALMVEKNKPDSPEYYIENDKSVAKTSTVSSNPNLEYLFESYDYPITKELNKKLFPPKNQMAEVEILENGKYDVKVLKDFTKEQKLEINRTKMIQFREKVKGLKVSVNRINYLSSTIDFLKKHGKVIMVRLPINKVPYSIEDKYYSDFDNTMIKLSQEKEIQYINFNEFNNNYKTSDEVHLIPESMNRLSQELGKILIEY
ncbi:hypothetical protein [Chryseobacterium taihuense]|uniref:Uncharacterized protein n=1 Tax=Chryseobacterium taihuense TaxID=1141221 RepID=A0ABY0QTK0_9FLAO|nr:hypothetical protein [Chryseobacterium taihuense]SDL85947.1 hypothetical protein SAMN05216273_107148 [Chryseobacterium taihuense]